MKKDMNVDNTIKAAIDTAYNAGYQAGLNNSDEPAGELLDKLTRLISSVLNSEEKEQYIKIDIGDLVRVNEDDSKSYMVYKVDEAKRCVEAIDPYLHKTIRIDMRDIHGVSKMSNEDEE